MRETENRMRQGGERRKNKNLLRVLNVSVGHRGDGRDGGRVCSGSYGEKEARVNQKTNTVGRDA